MTASVGHCRRHEHMSAAPLGPKPVMRLEASSPAQAGLAQSSTGASGFVSSNEVPHRRSSGSASRLCVSVKRPSVDRWFRSAASGPTVRNVHPGSFGHVLQAKEPHDAPTRAPGTEGANTSPAGPTKRRTVSAGRPRRPGDRKLAAHREGSSVHLGGVEARKREAGRS
jgi:hypothetical protein